MRSYTSYAAWIQTLNALFPYHKITTIPGGVQAFCGSTDRVHGEWAYTEGTGWITR